MGQVFIPLLALHQVTASCTKCNCIYSNIVTSFAKAIDMAVIRSFILGHRKKKEEEKRVRKLVIKYKVSYANTITEK